MRFILFVALNLQLVNKICYIEEKFMIVIQIVFKPFILVIDSFNFLQLWSLITGRFSG